MNTKKNHWRNEVWKEEALDDLPWKDERGPSSVKHRSSFKGNTGETSWEMGWSTYIYIWWAFPSAQIPFWTELNRPIVLRNQRELLETVTHPGCLENPSDHNEVAKQTDNFKQKRMEYLDPSEVLFYTKDHRHKRGFQYASRQNLWITSKRPMQRVHHTHWGAADGVAHREVQEHTTTLCNISSLGLPQLPVQSISHCHHQTITATNNSYNSWERPLQAGVRGGNRGWSH